MKLDGKDVSILAPEAERTLTPRIWALAAFAVLLVLGIAAVATLRRSPARTGEIRSADAYAVHLQISGLELSEATNGTGGKAIYVDGTLANTGSSTLTGALVQVAFASNDGSPPQRETLPLTLVRTREPYVDLQPVSSSPIWPGEHREFRLIFESVPANWDVKPPSIQVVHADLR